MAYVRRLTVKLFCRREDLVAVLLANRRSDVENMPIEEMLVVNRRKILCMY
jgi:hypothetical protein